MMMLPVNRRRVEHGSQAWMGDGPGTTCMARSSHHAPGGMIQLGDELLATILLPCSASSDHVSITVSQDQEEKEQAPI